jgi:prevent-host-death family protein
LSIPISFVGFLRLRRTNLLASHFLAVSETQQNHLTFWSGLVWSDYEMEVADMLITNISEAKAQLSALIEKVVSGQEVIIGKAGKPVAKLVRYERSDKKRHPGALRGKIKISDDFDELPEDIAEAFGMVEP